MAWDYNHNPLARPLGCNGKYGQSGMHKHYREGTETCERCRKSQRHYMKERRRGQPKPRWLKPCGTWAAAARHRDKGEELDFACRVAEATYQQERRDRKKGRTMNTPTYAYDAEPGAKPEEFTCAVIEGYTKEPECQHEVTDNEGVCLDCEQPVENWEPSDAQIPGTYEIRKAAA